ncbi:uncharacterized protein DS421_17g601480 [Arachis hypogaea]|nr:uncharacterized protein DS421_17g601480 [Arachis hypogaea]
MPRTLNPVCQSPTLLSPILRRFHLRPPCLREEEAEGDREVANRRSKPRSRSFIAVAGSLSQGRRRNKAKAEQHSNVQPVCRRAANDLPSSSPSLSKTPVAEPPSNQSLSCKNPKSNRTMSSSEPTSNEVPNEWTPEVGGENVESMVRSSTDSGALTKLPPHPRSKKRKIDSTNVGATSGATPTNPAPSTVDTDKEDGKDEANEEIAPTGEDEDESGVDSD